MKYLFLLFLISDLTYAVCTPISRVAATANQVLTSTKLNSDFNTVYNFVNDYDGGCIDAGSLESTAMDTTTFAPVSKGAMNGCQMSYSNSNTLSVDKCQIAVNGNLLTTASATTVTWGCSGCSSEATGSFYVYAANQSTFALKILSTAPDALGYSGNDRAIGAFYNDSALDINSTTVYTWNGDKFSPPLSSELITPGSLIAVSATIDTDGTILRESADFIQGSCTDVNPRVCTFQSTFWGGVPNCYYVSRTIAEVSLCQSAAGPSTSSVSIQCFDAAGTANTATYAQDIFCIGQRRGI